MSSEAHVYNVNESYRPENKKKEKTTMDTKTYVKKPFTVEAVQVTDDNFEEVASWVGGDIHADGSGNAKKYIKVKVHHPLTPKQTQAYVDDWVLKSSTGWKVYPNDAFVKHFDPQQSSEPGLLTSGDGVVVDG